MLLVEQLDVSVDLRVKDGFAHEGKCGMSRYARFLETIGTDVGHAR